MKFIPHKYQENMISELETHNTFGLFADPGTGKTGTILSFLNIARQKTLIIAPLRISYSVWPKQIALWDNFNNIKFTILHGPHKEQNFLRNDVGVYIINPEGLPWLMKMLVKHRRFPWKILVIDESAKFKSPSAKTRFKLIKKIINKFERRYILAGNPIPNTLMDLWSQIFILDHGVRLGKSFVQYKRKYFYQADFKGFVWKPHDWAFEAIMKQISDICMYIKADDYLDLPKMVINDIPFDLPSGVLKQYKTMESKLFSDIDSGKILASSAAVASQKCTQIANGFLYPSYNEIEKAKGIKRPTILLHQIKVELLKEIIEELNGSPILVGYWFDQDYLYLKKAFPKAVFFDKTLSFEECSKLEDTWNRGEIPVLLGQTSSISHGLNLQEAGNHVAFYSNVWNFDVYDQFIRRVLRQGNSEKRVFVHRFIANKTVDKAMILSVNNKGTVSSNFLNAINEYRKENFL